MCRFTSCTDVRCNISFWTEPQLYFIFIGGSDTEEEGTFKWIAGETIVWTKWHPHEPNNCCERGEDCMSVFGAAALQGTSKNGLFSCLTNYSCTEKFFSHVILAFNSIATKSLKRRIKSQNCSMAALAHRKTVGFSMYRWFCPPPPLETTMRRP